MCQSRTSIKTGTHWGDGSVGREGLPGIHEAEFSSQNIYVLVHLCNPDPKEVEGGAEIQGHPQLFIEMETGLGYMRPCLHMHGT